jgi:hypothetical protein
MASELFQQANFLDIAPPLTEFYLVVPLGGDDGKSPEILGKNWQSQATRALAQVKKWADRFPNANVGGVRDEHQYSIDFDSRDWFFEVFCDGLSAPAGRFPIVNTPNGVHLHIKGPKPAWARSVPNPKYNKDAPAKGVKPSLVEFPQQVVMPGSVNPLTGGDYRWIGDRREPGELPADWVDRLKSLYAKDLSPRALTCRPLKPGSNLKSILDNTELKGNYTIEERDGRVWFCYHEKLGRCLVKGAAHQKALNNNRMSGFYEMKADPSDWGHFCFASDCQCAIGGQRKVALASLGLELGDVLRPKCRDLAKSRNELHQGPLEFVVDRFIQEEGITGIGGPSGHGKTYFMLSLAKHISLGTPAFGLVCKKYPILYYLAEGGDRALLKRLNELQIEDSEDFLARTMSQGSTLALDHPGLVELATGRVIFLDTLPRWLQGREENSSTQMAALFQLGTDMLTAGAIAIVMAQHSLKPGPKTPFTMTPECVFRGSGDIVANLSCGHGLYQLDNQRRDKTLIHIECVKPRDFEPVMPFQLIGKPWINTEGDFRVHKEPGKCLWFKAEQKAFNASIKEDDPSVDPRLAAIQAKIKDGKTHQQTANELGISKRTVENILAKAKDSEPEGDEVEDAVEDQQGLFGETHD